MIKRVIILMTLLVYLLSLPLLITAQEGDLPYEEIVGATTLSNVNLRGDASTSNPAIGTLGQGEQVIILEEIPDGQSVSGNPLWYRVQLPDESEAFIWAGLLTEPEVISRICITYLEDNIDSSGWLVNHGQVWLNEFNVSKGVIEQVRVRATSNSWNIGVSPDELTSELTLPDNMTVASYEDEQNCKVTGVAIVTVDDDSYIPVRDEENGEIYFISLRGVSQIYYPEAALATMIEQAGETGNLNDDVTPDTIRNNFEYNDTYGGYTRTASDYTVVYRRFIDIPTIGGASDGEAVIMSEIVTPDIGTITFEQIHNMNGFNITQRPQGTFNDHANEVIPNGLRTFFLLAYQKTYLVSEEEAEELFENNVPLPLSWETEFRGHGSNHSLSNTTAHVRYYRPQSGVSFVILDQEISMIPGPPNTIQKYPALAIAFRYEGNIAGYTYGLDVEPNGRLIIYRNELFYTEYQDSYDLGLSSSIITGTFNAYKFTIDIQNNPTPLSISSPWHYDWNDIQPESPQEQIRMAFGDQSVEEYAQWWEEVKDLSLDEIVADLQGQNMFDVVLP